MKCDNYALSAFISHNAPYNSLLATSASTSSTSVWSNLSLSSQASVDPNSSATASDSDTCDSYFPPDSQTSVSSIGSCCDPTAGITNSWQKQRLDEAKPALPQELRKNPRRTGQSTTSRTGRPPALVRQGERKLNFVDNLVDSSTHIVEAIWPTSSVVARNESGNSSVLPLRAFIQETLRRSRTSYSTLQVALYYLILIRPHVPSHDFTMEQPDDRHASKAIQCGRRMFLAALILASKYLQDRNYSARAWSKISGLNTREINDNELAFLLAVNWKLHVTDEVYNRWTECVMKHTPPQPPSSGGTAQLQYDAQCNEFRHVILNLTPELDNLEELAPWSPILSAREIPVRSLYTPPAERIVVFRSKSDIQTVTTQQVTPPVMEPTLPTVCAPNRFAPALGLLPTPRLTPQTSGFSTPAVSAASCLLAKGSSMGFAMAQATSTVATQSADRWPLSETPSPPYQFTRRSSLANSVSTASSPESMVSDSSRVSRTSSVSSAASLASAPSSKLDVQARCRYAKQFGERWSLRPTVPSVAEDYEENCLTASPESYTAPVGKDFCDMPLGMPVAHRQSEMDDAARALQELQRDGANQRATAPLRPSLKRRRALSIENSLQDNVRDMLASRYTNTESEWLDTVVRSRPDLGVHGQQVPTRTSIRAGHKRVCCPAEAAGPYTIPSLHPAVGGYGGSGMWAGILN